MAADSVSSMLARRGLREHHNFANVIRADGNPSLSTTGQSASNRGALLIIPATDRAKGFSTSSSSIALILFQNAGAVEVYDATSVHWTAWASGGKCSPSWNLRGAMRP